MFSAVMLPVSWCEYLRAMMLLVMVEEALREDTADFADELVEPPPLGRRSQAGSDDADDAPVLPRLLLVLLPPLPPLPFLVSAMVI